jgi:hypothetical protein
LSLGLVREFSARNIPIEFITKSLVPEEVLEMMSGQIHSFGQISITTMDEAKRRLLMTGGASTHELFEQVAAIRDRGLFAVVRIDPVIPLITDSKRELKDLIARSSDFGAGHIVASVMDLPLGTKSTVFEKLKPFGSGKLFDLKKLYKEKICGYMNADISYRKRIFEFLRGECDKKGMTFALCMEFERVDNAPVGMNRDFMTSTNCEGIDIPLYRRDGDRFVPAADCRGDCLFCTEALCGVEDLAMARSPDTKKSFELSDYRRWSSSPGDEEALSTAKPRSSAHRGEYWGR